MDNVSAAVLTGAAGKLSDSSYGSSGSHRLCSKLHSIYVSKYIQTSIHTSSHSRSQGLLLTKVKTYHSKTLIYPFKGEDPAPAGDAQEDVDGAAVPARHHVGGGLAHTIHNGEPTQQFHHLGHSLLLAITTAEGNTIWVNGSESEWSYS